MTIVECFGLINNCLATTNKTALKAMTQNLNGLEWFGPKKDCWEVVDNIIAFKAMTQNMTADDWFFPKKTVLDWYGSKSEKYGPDFRGVSLFYKSLLRGIKPQIWLIKKLFSEIWLNAFDWNVSKREIFRLYNTKMTDLDWFGCKRESIWLLWNVLVT